MLSGLGFRVPCLHKRHFGLSGSDRSCMMRLSQVKLAWGCVDVGMIGTQPVRAHTLGLRPSPETDLAAYPHMLLGCSRGHGPSHCQHCQVFKSSCSQGGFELHDMGRPLCAFGVLMSPGPVSNRKFVLGAQRVDTWLT